MDKEDLKYLIALTLLPSIGSITARKLIAYSGSAEAVFREKKSNLVKIPGIGSYLAGVIKPEEALSKAEKEMQFMDKNRVSCITLSDHDYPDRLRQCPDAPLVLYYKGKNVFNTARALSIVGTRRATNYGTDLCKKIIREISESGQNVLIISGLAYGIDIQAHLSALCFEQDTVAVLAHGLHTIYPGAHRTLALKIESRGALLTDFSTGDDPERNNFLKRNRIIAGLSDATLVVESGQKGGALITAELALSYNRDVFAIPGRIGDLHSEGCNALIRTNKAALVEGYSDIAWALGWDRTLNPPLPRQTSMFHDLSTEEQTVVDALTKENNLGTDLLSIRTGFSPGRLSSILLGLEMKSIVSIKPGNNCHLIGIS